MTTKYTFICERDNNDYLLRIPKTSNTFVVEGEQTLFELIEKFEDFLRGNGYVFDGHFDLVDPNEDNLYGYNQDFNVESVDTINLDNLYPDSNLAFSFADDIIKSTY